MRIAPVVLVLAAAGQPFPQPAPQDVSTFGAGVQRTMALLASSTPQQRNTVKVLFYGQSITKQDWWKLVAADLRKRFPYANIIAENRAIGGYAAPMLKRTLEHDVFPLYPDLIIFHDYGAEPDYELIIRSIRERTTAEIALQSDHVTWLPEPGLPASEAEEKRKQWHDRHSFEWLRDLAAQYRCEWVELRAPWGKYLSDNHLKPGDLLTDGVHLNRQGEFLMAELTSRHLRYAPSINPPENLVTTYTDLKWSDGRLALEFEGNRVEVLASRSGRQTYGRAIDRIDGKKPSEFPELYAFTRPSDSYGVDWPFFNHVGSNTRLQVEDWTLKITETDAANSEVKFEVNGSKTGFDGSGNSKGRFVSRSGRVIILAEDWALHRAYDVRKILTPAGAIAHWKVIPLYADAYEPPPVDDRTIEYPVVVASGLSNGKHRLELIAETPYPPDVEGIRIYRPPVRPSPPQ